MTRNNPRKYQILTAAALAATTALAAGAAHAQSTDGYVQGADFGKDPATYTTTVSGTAVKPASHPPRVTIPAKSVAACRDGRVNVTETGTLTQANGGTATAYIGKIGTKLKAPAPGC